MTALPLVIRPEHPDDAPAIERLHGLEGPARELLLPGQLQVRGSSAAAAR